MLIKSNQNVDKTVYKSNKCGYTEVLVRLYTGKTHQIRVAFSHIGHPLVGDTLYGAQPTGKPYSNCGAQKVVFTHMPQASVLRLRHNLISLP